MIKFNKIKKRYKNKDVIKDTSFEVKDNRISFIMGENGAGKTTLIKCMANLEDYEGNITYGGKDIDKVRSSFFVLFDDCPFYNNLSGLDNLLIFSENKMKKNAILHFAEKILDRNVLRSKVKTYSNGQRKKLGIILMEILKPEYIILDEISNGLDYESLKDLKKNIKHLSSDSTILMTGHQFDFYNDLVDDLYLFKGGAISREDNYEKGMKKLEEVYDEKLYKARA